MSFISFMNAMLGDEMKELGFSKGKKTDSMWDIRWYKLVDDQFFLSVWARKLSYGMYYLYFSMCSLFAEHLNCVPNVYGYDVAHLKTQEILSKNGDIGTFGIWLRYQDEKTEQGQKDIEAGRNAFSLAKPILTGVHDLQSCFEAKQKAGYLTCFYYGKQWMGREYTPDDHAEFEPDDAYYILCRLGKYEAAADYVRQYLKEFRRVQTADLERLASENPTRYMEVLRETREEMIQQKEAIWKPYIELAESRDIEKLNSMMIKNYNANCDMLEEKYKLNVDRSKVVL